MLKVLLPCLSDHHQCVHRQEEFVEEVTLVATAAASTYITTPLGLAVRIPSTNEKGTSVGIIGNRSHIAHADTSQRIHSSVWPN